MKIKFCESFDESVFSVCQHKTKSTEFVKIIYIRNLCVDDDQRDEIRSYYFKMQSKPQLSPVLSKAQVVLSSNLVM